MNSMVHSGTGSIAFYNKKTGLGRIIDDEGKVHHFHKITKIHGGLPKEGDKVGFLYKTVKPDLLGVEDTTKIISINIA
jgi:cold shock CspA family protein